MEEDDSHTVIESIAQEQEIRNASAILTEQYKTLYKTPYKLLFHLTPKDVWTILMKYVDCKKYIFDVVDNDWFRYLKVSCDSGYGKAVYSSYKTKEHYLSWHSFLFLVSTHMLLPTDMIIMCSFAFLGLTEVTKISMELYRNYLVFMGLNASDFYMNYYQQYAEENKGYMLFSRFIDLLSDINEIFESLTLFRLQLSKHTLDSYWGTINRRIKEMPQIVEYLRNNNGMLPPETCCTVLKRSINNHPNPFYYEYCCETTDEQEKRLVSILNQLQMQFLSSSAACNPSIHRLKRIGSSYTNVSNKGMSGGGQNTRLSHSHLSNCSFVSSPLNPTRKRSSTGDSSKLLNCTFSNEDNKDGKEKEKEKENNGKEVEVVVVEEIRN